MDILILNTYPARSSLFRDNGTGNTLVHKRRGEGSQSCVGQNPDNLAFCSRAPAFYREKKHMGFLL